MRNSLYCYFTNVLPVSYKTVLVVDYDLHFHLPIFSLKAKLNCFLALFNCIYTCTHWLKAEYEDVIFFSFFSHHSFFFSLLFCCSYLDCTFPSSFFFFRFSKFSFFFFFFSVVCYFCSFPSILFPRVSALRVRVWFYFVCFGHFLTKLFPMDVLRFIFFFFSGWVPTTIKIRVLTCAMFFFFLSFSFFFLLFICFCNSKSPSFFFFFYWDAFYAAWHYSRERSNWTFFFSLFHLLPELLGFLCSKASFVFPLIIIRVVFFFPTSFFFFLICNEGGKEREREEGDSWLLRRFVPPIALTYVFSRRK